MTSKTYNFLLPISPKNEVDFRIDHGKYNRNVYFHLFFSQSIKRKRSIFLTTVLE